jgi:hypothetical protein
MPGIHSRDRSRYQWMLRSEVGEIMETFWQDLRYSLRTLLKRPGFTFVVVATLALGIGANATISTWIKAVLLPGIEQPEKLVEIWGATRNNSALSSSYVDYLDYRDQNKVLSGLIAHQVLPLNLGRSEKPERVWGAIVSGNYFDVLGVKAMIGRTFLLEEERTPNTHPVVVVGYGLWERRFGADPNVLGRAITLGEHDFTVIGVAPKDFASPFAGLALDVWTPVAELRLQASRSTATRRLRTKTCASTMRPSAHSIFRRCASRSCMAGTSMSEIRRALLVW